MDTTRRSSGKVLAATLAAGAVLMASGAASAGDVVTQRDDGRRTIKVRVGDLDGTREAGAEAMYSRLQLAARRVCGSGDRNLAVNRMMKDCREIAMRDAVASANLPKLSAVHAAKTGETGASGIAVASVRPARAAD